MASDEHVSVQGKKPKMFYSRVNPQMSYGPGSNGRQNHHILPCTSVKKSLFGTDKDRVIKGVIYFTDWNINKSDNMIELPTFKVFQNAYGKKGGKQGGVLQPQSVGLACHTRGHPKYNENVQTALTGIWAKAKPKVDEHKLTSAEDISGELDGKIGDFKFTIEGRATTQANWKKLVNGDASAMMIFYMAV
jgi:hypothetical protein